MAALLHRKSAAPSLPLTNGCARPGNRHVSGCRSAEDSRRRPQDLAVSPTLHPAARPGQCQAPSTAPALHQAWSKERSIPCLGEMMEPREHSALPVGPGHAPAVPLQHFGGDTMHVARWGDQRHFGCRSPTGLTGRPLGTRRLRHIVLSLPSTEGTCRAGVNLVVTLSLLLAGSARFDPL